LGQHFLVDEACVNEIVAQASGFSGVLEIGPGPGILTKGLTESAEKVIALEVDGGILNALRERAPRAQVVFQDALEADWGALLDDLPQPTAIVSNMPYNITGPLLSRVGAVKDRIGRAVLMMQKEVGDRILAPAGNSDRGSLSVFLEARFTIRRLRRVPAGAFLPPPKVESIVLVLDPKPEAVDERLEAVVRAGFGQPRKTLANNLTATFGGREKVVERLVALGLGESIRPHQLTLEQWVALLP
jgi:16S rRNA (adenine1518-N6/adenine1519-N6)-dimethyltransferase